MNHRLQRIATTIALACMLLLAAGAVAAPVTVKVSEFVRPGGATYFYRVENTTNQPIVGLKIGFDRTTGEPLLPVTPLGWTLESGLPSSSAKAPAGWSARVVLTEETDLTEVDWSSDGDPAFDVAPGATALFAVVVPRPVDEYRTSKFDLFLGDGTSMHGTLQLDDQPLPDRVPPALTLELNPAEIWPPDRKLVTINAAINVTDQIDPAPQVRLVSITANEPLQSGDISGADIGTDDRQFSVRAERVGNTAAGRVYTATYSATDAAGNVTTASATVTVLHDQRR